MSNQVEVRLFEKEDRHGGFFMIGSTDFPAVVDLSKVTFVVFYPAKDSDRGSLMIRANTGRPKRPYVAGETENEEHEDDEG